jgi:aldose 1-epimerase
MAETWTLENGRHTRVVLTSRGAAIQRILFREVDVVLGFPDPTRYAGPHPYFGVVVGRYANRIAHGRYTLDGVTHELPRNDGRHQLHGGPAGFSTRVWSAARDGNALRFSLLSPDGDQGHPGRLEVEATYLLDDDDALTLELRARCDRPTVVSLANHSYWNLADGGASPILDHELELDAERWLPVDPDGIPTGELADVRGTPFDFTRRAPIGARLPQAERSQRRGGYDHCFALRGEGLRPVARLVDPASGRALTIETTQPALQLYSGNFLDGTLVGHGGSVYRRFHGLALETQGFPDAPNQPRFPSPRLEPGEEYRHTTVFRLQASSARSSSISAEPGATSAPETPDS